MKRVAVMTRPGVAHDHDLLSRFARGVQAHGDEAVVMGRSPAPPKESTDAVAVWGWRMGLKYRAMGHRTIVVLERGFVGDRFRWTSIGLNGLNGRAKFPEVEGGGARWEQHFGHLLQQWHYRPRGYALIMGQVPTDTAVRDITFASWVRGTQQELQRRMPQLQIKFRPHPLAPNFRPNAVRETLGSLADALAGAALAVTFNSNSGVDAVLAGVPTVALDAGSMVYPVASHSIAEEPIRPDRTAWAHALAWKQWLPAELESGEAWARLRTLV